MSNVYEICFYGGLILAIIFLLLSITLFIVLKIPKVFGELTGRAAKKDIKERQQKNKKEDSISKKEQAKYYNQNTGKIKVRDAVSQETIKENHDDTTDNLTQQTAPSKKLEFKQQEIQDATAHERSGKATPDFNGNATEEETVVLTADMDEEATDVLRSDVDEEATDVLKSDVDEEATDVLKSDVDEEATDVLKSDIDEEATDILTSDAHIADEEATDILRADFDEDATDVLRGENMEDGSTTVLRVGRTRQLASKVKVIYNIVVVNTSEKI